MPAEREFQNAILADVRELERCADAALVRLTVEHGEHQMEGYVCETCAAGSDLAAILTKTGAIKGESHGQG